MPHPLKINTRSELSKYPLKKMDKVLVLGKRTQTQTHSYLYVWLEKKPLRSLGKALIQFLAARISALQSSTTGIN